MSKLALRAVFQPTDFFLGTGNRLRDEIGALVNRTVAWIEQDMNRSEVKQITPSNQQSMAQGVMQQPAYGPQQTPLIKQDPNGDQHIGQPVNGFASNDHQRAVMASNGTSHNRSNNNNNNNTNNSNGYYEPEMPGSVYPTTAAYPNQPPSVMQATNNGTIPAAGGYDTNANTQYLYTHNGHTAGVDQSSDTSNTLIAFASQATAQVGTAQSSTVDEWRQQPQPNLVAAAEAAQIEAQAQAQAQVQGHGHGGSSWHDWTAAMADNHAERYSANALLHLNAGRPGDGSSIAASNEGMPVAVSGDMGLVQVPGPTAHTGQWPLIVFNDGSKGALNNEAQQSWE